MIDVQYFILLLDVLNFFSQNFPKTMNDLMPHLDEVSLMNLFIVISILNLMLHLKLLKKFIMENHTELT